VVWSVLHCKQCSFSWRDSEPPESISPEKRDPFFNVNPEEVKRYPIVLPPMA
jgi:C4-type Zn-finger protein